MPGLQIVHHWSEKKETTPLPEAKKKQFLLESAPVFSTSVPLTNGT